MIQWSFECGEILNAHLVRSYDEPLKVINKGKQGVATEADVLSEKYVMQKIREHYPAHKILSEVDAFTNEVKLEAAKKNEYSGSLTLVSGFQNPYDVS